MKRKIVETGIVLCLTAALVWIGSFSATDAKASQNESEIYTYADAPDGIYRAETAYMEPAFFWSGDTLLLEIYWDGAPYGEEAVTGTVEYEIDTGSYREFDLQLESVG